MKTADLWEEIVLFVRDRLPADYRLALIINHESVSPYLAVLGGPQFKTHLIIVKAPDRQLTARESDFANWCLMHAAAGWCCVRSVSDAEKALIHWGICQ